MSLPTLATKPGAAKLAPYRVSIVANAQRSHEEERVRRKMAERRVREEAHQKEALRRRVVALARQEAESLAQPKAIAADLDGQKRYLAYLGTLRSDEQYYLARSQLQMRWFDATPDEKEEREAAWQQRRAEHRLQHEARQATLTVRPHPRLGRSAYRDPQATRA